MEVWSFLFFLLSALYHSASSQIWLRADGSNDTLTLIDKVLGTYATRTVPDCKHHVEHITMANDEELKRPVFLFHLHVDLDDDYCQSTGRQRTEIGPFHAGPDDVKGFNQNTVYLSWNFKLDAKFQPSKLYTHIHKLSSRLEALSILMFSFDVRKGPPDVLQIVHYDSTKATIIGHTPLDPLKGIWVHVQQNMTYSSKGSYSVSMTKVSDGSLLFNLTNNNLEMWMNGATYVIPKWGIYRNLSMKNELRDEIVKFDSFCLGKGSNICQ